MALSALGWVLSESTRAERLLALSGVTPDGLRTGLGDPALLGAVLSFVEAHEPDLIACATAIGATPERIVAARHVLAPEGNWE